MYQTLSADYDRFVNWKNRLAYELPFIEKQIASLLSSADQALDILDAACGTGMHAVALARLGHHLSGADLVPEMVELSKQNARSAGVTLDLKIAGFGELERAFGTRRFDLLLCLGNSLPHILNLEDLTNTFKDFAACLRPGGILLIQNRNFDAVMATMDRWMEPQAHSEGNNEWLFQRFYDFEPDGLIRFNIITLKRREHGDWTSSVTSTRLFPQLKNDLSERLAYTGFTNLKIYGSMAGDEFSPLDSGNLVITATRK